MLPLDNEPLGIIISLLERPISFVVKISISFTTPTSPWASIKSPILIGLKIIIKTPPAKLPREPCKASPIAKPAAASTAAKEVVPMPTLPNTTITKTIFKDQLTRFNKNFSKLSP